MLGEMPKVSILVPVYNVENYLVQCLEGIMAQSLADIEILCLDDGSTDKSGEILDAYAAEDERIQVIHKENSGYGKTMNLGLRKACGEYVGIVESDDFIDASMYEIMYENAIKYEADVVKTDFWQFMDHAEDYEPFVGETYYDRVLSGDEKRELFIRNPSIWSGLYQRDFLRKNKIWFSETPGASFQDIAFRIKVFACAERPLVLRKAFYHYRRDNPNASVRDNGKLDCVCYEYDEAERFLTEKNDWKEIYQYFLPYLRMGHYQWNCFGRWLDWNYRYLFFEKHIVGEFSRLYREGRLRREFWDENQWKSLQKILHDDTQFFFDSYCFRLRADILWNGLSHILRRKDIVIYGAGKVGREVAEKLKRRQMDFLGFAVADTKGNPADIYGKPVANIAYWQEYAADIIILIAVNEKLQPVIVCNLFRMNFPHVVSMSFEMRLLLTASV